MRETDQLRSLRGVRRFANLAIPAEVLDDILETARWTGSSKNTQPWELIVVQERGTLEALSRCGRYAGHVAGAPLAIAVVMEGSDAETGFDEGRLTERLMLAAWMHGVGSCVGSIYPENNRRIAREVLGIPEPLRLATMVSVGFLADPLAMRVPRGTPMPLGRKPLEKLVSWERYGRHRG